MHFSVSAAGVREENRIFRVRAREAMLQCAEEFEKRGEASESAKLGSPRLELIGGIIPAVAPLHGSLPGPGWSAVEIDVDAENTPTIVREAVRRDCSKTQYLRTLLLKAMNKNGPSLT